VDDGCGESPANPDESGPEKPPARVEAAPASTAPISSCWWRAGCTGAAVRCFTARKYSACCHRSISLRLLLSTPPVAASGRGGCRIIGGASTADPTPYPRRRGSHQPVGSMPLKPGAEPAHGSRAGQGRNTRVGRERERQRDGTNLPCRNHIPLLPFNGVAIEARRSNSTASFLR
jgi:hypothetical protein